MPSGPSFSFSIFGLSAIAILSCCECVCSIATPTHAYNTCIVTYQPSPQSTDRVGKQETSFALRAHDIADRNGLPTS